MLPVSDRPGTLYVATSNAGKLRDFAVAAAAHHLSILPLPGLAGITAPPENAATFEANAREKAEYYSHFLPGAWVLADDSGIEVDHLGGAPGVRSARYAADAGFRAVSATDANNSLLLLRELTGVNNEKRTARYRCALAVARDGVSLLTAEGKVEGRVLIAPRGGGGFGYDPVFYLPELGKTMAELDSEARWHTGHRGTAFKALLKLWSDG